MPSGELPSPVDQMYPEGEVPVVESEAVRTLVHRPVTPLGQLLRPDLTTLLADVDVRKLHVVKLHVSLVVLTDGLVVLGLDVAHQLAPDEEEGLVTDGALVVTLLCDLGRPVLRGVLPHPDPVRLVDVRPQVTELDTFVTDLTSRQTLVLVIIAEHAVGVDLTLRQTVVKVPLTLHLGEVILAVLPETDLVSGEVCGQPAPGEEEDLGADLTLVVGGHKRDGRPILGLVFRQLYPMFLEMDVPGDRYCLIELIERKISPEVLKLNILVTNHASRLEDVCIVLRELLLFHNRSFFLQ